MVGAFEGGQVLRIRHESCLVSLQITQQRLKNCNTTCEYVYVFSLLPNVLPCAVCVVLMEALGHFMEAII